MITACNLYCCRAEITNILTLEEVPMGKGRSGNGSPIRMPKGSGIGDDDRRHAEKIRRIKATQQISNFRSVPQRDDPSVTNHYFNEPGDVSEHGHVKEQENLDGSKSYPYIRGVDGTEYNPI